MKYLISFWPFLIIVMALSAAKSGWIEAGWVLGGLAILLLVCLMWQDLWMLHNDELEKRSWLYNSRSKFLSELLQSTQEQLQFLSVEFPELGVELEPEPIVYLLDNMLNTGINLEFFRKFIQDSSDKEFADVREYNDDKTLQERFNVSRDTVRAQWQKSVGFLAKKGYLLPNSAAGPHSYLWKSKGHYRKIARRYVSVHTLTDLGDPENA